MKMTEQMMHVTGLTLAIKMNCASLRRGQSCGARNSSNDLDEIRRRVG